MGYTQDEVYGLKSDVSIASDVPLDYMPENDCYRVVKIVKGANKVNETYV